MTLSLSTVAPDFDSIKAQLEVYLQGRDAWRGVLTTQTGQTLLEMIAAVGALNQLSIQRFGEDAFPYTALNDQAIYATAFMLGLRLSRKRPAQCTVLLSNPTNITIPPYTAFSIAGIPMFNRSAFNLTPTPQYFVLYEGEIKEVIASGIGTDYATFISTEESFTVSDTDVTVLVNSVEVPKTWDGLWKVPALGGGCRDRTLPSGHMLIEFGNELYGTKPNPSDTVQIIYAITSGAAANSFRTKDVQVTSDLYSDMVGVGNTDMSGGANETSPLVYRNVGGTAFGTFGSAVTKDQYRSLVLTYSGVIDGATFAQRETNPYAYEWMNVIRVTVLTSSPWAPNQKETFLNWLQERSMYSGRFVLQDPVQVPVDISVEIFCYNFANVNQCKVDAENAINAVFQLNPGILNYDVHKSDLIQAILRSNSGIEYVNILEPTEDMIEVAVKAMDKPVVSVVEGTGFLLPGNYMYSISAVTAEGEIAPKNWVTLNVVNPSSTVHLSWAPVTGATSYKVWGRSTNINGLIASVILSTEFSDNGSIIPTQQTSPQTTVPLRYPVLNSLSVVSRYSTRNPARALQG